MAAVGAEIGRRGCHGRCACRAAPRARRTTAPAPSPNSTQVPRSFQSRMREKVSAPITSAVCAWPDADEIVGGGERVDEAGAHRLQVEGDARGRLPSLRWTAVAVAGKVWSGRRGRDQDQIEVAEARCRPAPGPARAARSRDRRSARHRPRGAAARCPSARGSTRRRCRAGRASSSLLHHARGQIGADASDRPNAASWSRRRGRWRGRAAAAAALRPSRR